MYLEYMQDVCTYDNEIIYNEIILPPFHIILGTMSAIIYYTMYVL